MALASGVKHRDDNNRILSDQSNNINTNQGVYETKEDDKPTELIIQEKRRVKTKEEIKRKHDELNQIQQEYSNLKMMLQKLLKELLMQKI